MMQITEIAEIYSGYPFRRAIEHDPQGKFAVVQMRDLKDYTKVTYENLASVNGIYPKPHHFLEKGDLLFIAKGMHNFAAHIDKQVCRTVAAANFLVIRVNVENVLPEYLAWCINQGPAQAFLKENAKGSYIPSISKRVLSELQIPLPTLELQQKIVRTQQLMNLEHELIAQIQNKRKIMMEALLLKTANGGEPNGTR